MIIYDLSLWVIFSMNVIFKITTYKYLVSHARESLFYLLFFYFSFATRAGLPQKQMPITARNPPFQLPLWKETDVPRENPRLSAE